MSQLLRLKHGEYFVLGPFRGVYQYDVEEGSAKYAVFKLWHDSEPSYVKAKLYLRNPFTSKVFFTTETAEMLIIDRFVLSSTNSKVFNITYCWNMTNISTPIPVLMHRYDYLVTTEGESGVGMMLDDFSDLPDVAIVSFCDKNLECTLNGDGGPIRDQIREGETKRIYVPGFGDIYVHNYDTNADEGFAILGIFPYNAWGKQIYRSESISVENKQTQSVVSKLPSKITIAK